MMKSVQLLLGIFCLIIFIGFTSAQDVKIKNLIPIDDATNTNDKLKIICEGTFDSHTMISFILQIEEPDPLPPRQTKTILRQLTATVDQATDLSPGFSVEFDYHTDTGDENVIGEILNKELSLDLVIEDGDGKVVASEKKDISTTGITVFPPSPSPKFITDTNAGNARWVRIDSVNGRLVTRASATVDLDCQTDPCYLYENPAVPANTYRICEDTTPDADEADKVYLCSNGDAVATDITLANDDDVPSQIILDHSGKLQLILADAKAATTVDLVVHKSTDKPAPCEQGLGIPDPLTTDPLICEASTIVADTDPYKILLVGYEGPSIKWTNDYTVDNHNLKAKLFTGTLLEASWDHTISDGTQQYSISRNTYPDDHDAGLSEALVDCSAVPDLCSAYFFDVPPSKTYQVTLQDIINFNGGLNPELSKVSIRSADSEEISLAHETDIIMQEESLKTTILDDNLIIEVCLKNLRNISREDFYYEFLIVNRKGQWKKERNLHMKDFSYSCFKPVEAPISDFRVDTKALVLLRNTKDRKILSLADLKLQVPGDKALKPEVDNGSNGSSSTLAIVGAAIAGVACLMALVAAAIMFVMKAKNNKDGLQYPLHRRNIEDSNIIHGLENPIPTM